MKNEFMESLVDTVLRGEGTEDDWAMVLTIALAYRHYLSIEFSKASAIIDVASEDEITIANSLLEDFQLSKDSLPDVRTLVERLTVKKVLDAP